MKKLLILAALTAVSFGQPAFAQTVPANATLVVQHSDLDLGTAAGAKTLQHRIWRAVVAVCGTTSDFDLAGKNDIQNCRRDTLRVSTVQADLAIASASDSRPIQVSSIR